MCKKIAKLHFPHCGFTLPHHFYKHLHCHLSALLIEKMNGRDRRYHHSCNFRIPMSGNQNIIRHSLSMFFQIAYRSCCHSIRCTDNSIQIRIFLQQFSRLLVSGIRSKGSNNHLLCTIWYTGFTDRILITAKTLRTDCLILYDRTDISWISPAHGNHCPCQVSGSMIIIMIYATMTGILLPDQDHGNRELLKSTLMLCCQDCRRKDHTIHLFVIKSSQILQFFLWIILRHRKKHLITTFIQYRKYSLDNFSYACGSNLRYDHSDHFGFFCAECLRLNRRPVTCLFYNLANCFFLFFRNISVIKITGNCRAGYTC